MASNIILLKAATVIYYEYKSKNAIVIFNNTKIVCNYDYENKKLVYGDAIYGKFKPCPGEGGNFITIKGNSYEYYSPVQEPLIILGRDTKTIKKVFEEAIRVYNLDRYTNLNSSYAVILAAAKIAKENIDDYMDKYSDHWYRYKNKPNISILPTPEMDDKIWAQLVKWWVYSRLLRQLSLFDIDKKMISVENRSLINITHDFINNPFKIISLPLDVAESKFNFLFKTPTKNQKAAGMIARIILQKLNIESSLYLDMRPSFEPYLEDLNKDYGVVMSKIGGSDSIDRGLYLPYPNLVETTVAKYLNYCLNYKENKENIDKIINIKFNNELLNPEQKAAIKGSLSSKVSLISGGAGTGKTTVINELIYQIEKELNGTCLVTSFTGKAVTRLKQVTGEKEIFTMDRLIRLAGKGPESDIPPFEYLIIDEVSMVCTELFYRFINKVCNDKPINITLVGDINQLPPVTTEDSWGNFFMELSNVKNLPTYQLIKNHRSDVIGANGIIENSEKLVQHITQKREPTNFNSENTFKFTQYNNFAIIPGDINTVLAATVKLTNSDKHNISFEKSTIKIICPYNSLTSHINERIRNILLKNNQHIIDSYKIQWYKGGLVMLTKNYHPLGVMNGDEGIITEIDSYLRKITVTFFNGKVIQFDCDNPKEYVGDFTNDSETKPDRVINSKYLIYSYAITVHKSQGSEWEYVIYHLPSYTDDKKFVNFNLTYTAITRPRKALWIIGDEEQLNFSAKIKLDNKPENLRYLIE